MKMKLVIFTSIFLNLLFAAKAKSDVQNVKAYFYEFKPSTCLISLNSSTSTSDCSHGIISVAKDDSSSVNISLISERSMWQLVLSEGDTSQPKIGVIAVYSIENLKGPNVKPQFLLDRDNGDIIRGTCSSIKIMKKTSGNCEVLLKGGNTIQIKFETNNLKLSDNVR